MDGLLQHLLISLRLNFRSRQALIYGYVVPVFFLLAFGSVFRSTVPPLVNEMGQLLTITVLGGACFGMPTTMVSERERGVWRRYRLLPSPVAGLMVSTMVARYVIVALAAVLQVVLAWCFYRTPFPAHPIQLAVAFTFVCFAFLGLGLIIAMIAENVPAVQALGQAIFLPMIMIGGVGVPLRALPEWARNLAGFLPGRYAVEALQACIPATGPGLAGTQFALVALVVIGLAACVAGAMLFRWDSGATSAGGSRKWLLLALAAWAVVGFAAFRLHRLAAPITQTTMAEGWEKISLADIAGITYDDLPEEDGTVSPMAADAKGTDADDQARIDDFRQEIANWSPGREADPVQRTRYLLSACAIPDLAEDQDEAAIPVLVLDRLKQQFSNEELEKILTWIILHPDDGKVVTAIPELGIEHVTVERRARERCVFYAKRFLLRLAAKH